MQSAAAGAAAGAVPAFSLLGALDIEGLRSTLLEQWGELWAPADFGGGGTNDYNSLP